METVITAKLLLNVSYEQFSLLEAVSCAYIDACNHVSSLAVNLARTIQNLEKEVREIRSQEQDM